MRLEQLDEIPPGAKLAQPLYGHRGRLLLGKGVTLTRAYLDLLRKLGVPAVYVQDPDTADVVVPEPVSARVRAATLANLSDAFDQLARAGEQIRHVPPEMLRDHLEKADFVKGLVAAGAGDALCDMAADVNNLIRDLDGHDVLTGLNTIKTHDQYTFMHSLDVSVMGLVLANAAGWEGVKLRSFGVACLLHDLGKILISPDLLNKTGPLTPAEFDQFKSHPAIGYEVIRAIAPRLGSLVPACAHQHHERQDGSGYPRGLRGNDRLGVNEPGRIHDYGALCAVADVYDAMASDRPYRRARPIDEVVATITRGAGAHFNAEAVRIFCNTTTPYPACSAVTVLTGPHAGREGIVTEVNKRDLARPKIRLLYDATKTRIAPVEIDLSVDRDIEIRSTRAEQSPPHSMGSPKPNPELKPFTHTLPKAVLAALKRTA